MSVARFTPVELNFGRLGNRLFQLAYVYAQVKEGKIPDVWIQFPQYFDTYRREIQELFGARIRPREEVSLHIRRGDYVNHPSFVNLWDKTDYYRRALALFPGRKFLIFSDDPKWCREQPALSGPEFQVMDCGSEWDDLIRMAGCRDHILANSSYSWWAAYLDPNPAKQVIYPLAWHTDGVVRVGFPPEWRGL